MGEYIGHTPLNNKYRRNNMVTQSHIENLNTQIRISDVISVLMEQSNLLMDIVNKNQKEVNRLKKQLEQLKTHTDNSTDHIES
jgi:ABC-type transporter Mla subunit MlaD